MVSNWRRGVERWIPGRITKVKGPRTYLVRCGNQIGFVDVDHLKRTGCRPSSPAVEESAFDCAREFGESQAKKTSDSGVSSELTVGVYSRPGPAGCPGPESKENLSFRKETQKRVTEDAPKNVDFPGLSSSLALRHRYPRRERRLQQRPICEF